MAVGSVIESINTPELKKTMKKFSYFRTFRNFLPLNQDPALIWGLTVSSLQQMTETSSSFVSSFKYFHVYPINFVYRRTL